MPSGPVPKRSDQRRHRQKVDITHAPATDDVVIPEPSKDWNPIAAQWYLALQKSGQRVFFESSDWAQAFYVAEAMSRSLEYGRMSANMFAAVITASSDLLVTEGHRRRMRIELERAGVAEPDRASQSVMDEYRKLAEAA